MKILLLAYVCLLLSLGNTLGQEMTLTLNPDVNSAQERNYLFGQVKDSRLQQSIGHIYDSQRKKLTADYGGKLAEQSLSFYNARITPSKNPSYRLLVKIYNLDLKEIYHTDRQGYKGEVQLSLGFFLIGENEPVHLVDFNSKVQYGRPANQMHFVETSIQRLFENSWEYFDAWLSTQYKSNRSLVKKVRLNILDPKRPSSKDTVFYDPERPLTWEDFTESPNPTSSYNAAIFSSFSIQGNALIKNGEIVQTIEVKVYMLPGQSWVKSADNYANNHEQKHFDLTRIVADRMIERLNKLELEPNLYEAKINEVYLDAYREMNLLQEMYDQQTRNGINKEVQSSWNQATRKALDGDMGSLEKLKLVDK